MSFSATGGGKVFIWFTSDRLLCIFATSQLIPGHQKLQVTNSDLFYQARVASDQGVMMGFHKVMPS